MTDLTLTAPILCGVDFSEHSRRALACAVALGSRLHAPVVAVAALDPLLNEAAEREYGAGHFRAAARRDVEALAREVAGGPIAAIHVEVGDPAAVLLAAAHESGASMLVAGTQGLGAAKRFLFGSTTWRLLRTSDVPILAVPPGAFGTTSTDVMFGEVLCGVDFGEASTRAARVAVQVGRALGVPVTLVHAAGRAAVPQVWSMFAPRQSAADLDAADRRLRDLASSFGETAPAFRVEPGATTEVFHAAAAEHRPLVVLGLGGSDGRRPGSTAIKILSETPAPLLAIP